MTARCASLLLALLFCLAPARAQDAPPAEAKPSQEQIAAAMDLLAANNTAANMQTMLDVMLPQAAAQFRREHPTASDETVQIMTRIVRESVSRHSDDLVRIYAIAYARHFSIDEMHTLAAFYRSEPGQKYLKEIPALVKETTPVAAAYLRGVLSQEIQQAVEKLRAQGMKI